MELIEHLGGAADPAAPASASQLVPLLRRELARGLAQVAAPRAGYDRPLVLTVAATPGLLSAVLPVPARFRADARLAGDQPRSLLLAAASLDALLLIADHHAARPGPGPGALVAKYAAWEDALVISVPWQRAIGPGMADAELAALALEEHLAQVDRLRVVTAALPDGAATLVVAGLEHERPIGHRHPLDALEVLVRAGMAPAPAAAAVLDGTDHAATAIIDAALGPPAAGHRPHEDPVPARRIARRVLQMLMGKRKWSGGTGAGYHTEVTHLTRGFESRDRELAGQVVEALLSSGLLVEKQSVGQRHVSLLSRRAADISALVDFGEVPPDLHLPG